MATTDSALQAVLDATEAAANFLTKVAKMEEQSKMNHNISEAAEASKVIL